MLSPFLQARLLLGVEPKKSEELAQEVLERAPDFPWAHLALVAWTEFPDRRNVVRAEKHMREFRRLCPESLAAFAHYRNIEDLGLLREAAQALGRILLKRADAEAVAAFRYKWDLLMRTRRGPEQNAARMWIRADLVRLLGLNRTHSAEWLSTLRYGYGLLQDEAGWAALKRRIERGPD